MKLSRYYLILLFFIPNLSFSQEYGLQFYANEKRFSEKTCLELNHEDFFDFKNDFEIKFKLSLDQSNRINFGYILRVITSNKYNIDLLYDPVSQSLNLIDGTTEKVVSIPIAIPQLSDWVEISIKFYRENNSVKLSVGNRNRVLDTKSLKDETEWKFLFGLNHTKTFKTSDTPSMKLRNIRLYDDSELKHKWILDKKSGNEIKDEIGNVTARVDNPLWLYGLHESWKLEKELEFSSYVKFTKDEKTDNLIFLTKDSLYSLKLYDLKFEKSEKLKNSINLQKDTEIIFDYLSNKIVYYSIDQKKFAKLDLETLTSSEEIPALSKTTAYSQHNKFFNPRDTSLLLFGGYGYLKYKNSIQYVNLKNKEWTTSNVDNNILEPRYLSSLGTTKNNDTLFILGGYGTLTGNQAINPGYDYDLVRILPNKRKLEIVYSFNDTISDNFCFSNSMIIDDGSDTFYALSYSKYEYQNEIKLVKGSLSSPILTYSCATFPFVFDDILSYVDLLYSKSQKKLYAVILFHNYDGTSNVKIYSVLFPPTVCFTEHENKSSQNILWYIIIISIILLLVVIMFFKKKKSNELHIPKIVEPTISVKQTHLPKKSPIIKDKTTGASDVFNNIISNSLIDETDYSIVLFGGFNIINKKNINITQKFTPLLKELFLLIFLNSKNLNGIGISSSKMNEILWYDKTAKEAGNNRAVNIARIRKLLKELGGITISKTTGYWKLECKKSLKTDYTDSLNIIHLEKYNEQDVVKLLEITKRGKFLHGLSYEWLYSYKADISNKIIDFFTYYIKNRENKIDPHLLIEITNIIFSYDSVNEEALAAKCLAFSNLGKHSLSKNIYNTFVKEYKILYNEEYPKSYNQTIEEVQ